MIKLLKSGWQIFLKLHVYIIIVLTFIACNQSAKTNTEQAENKIQSNDSLLIDSLTVLINHNSQEAILYAQRGMAYQRIGKYTKSINDFTQANKLDTLNIDYYLQLSDKYLKFGKSGKTRDLLLKANSIDANNVQVLYRLANLYFYVKDYKQSVLYLKQAKNIDPFYSPLYFTYAMIFKEKGDTLKAIEQLQIAVEREPKYYDAYILLGALYAGKRDSLALDYYRNALKIIPESYEANYAIAMFYQLNDMPEQALDIYKQMLELPNYQLQNIYFNMGYIEMIYYGGYANALEYFDTAIQIQNNYPAAYCNIGYCYEKLQNKIQAEYNYKQALELEPDFEIAKLGLERIKKN